MKIPHLVFCKYGMEKKDLFKKFFIFLTICILLFPIFPIQDAFATTTIEWRLLGSQIFTAPLDQGNVFGTSPFVTLHVEDTDLASNSNIDSINVQLTSTAGDSITITLTEIIDDGMFDSGRIVLMQGTDRFSINGIGTITIEDTTCGGTCDTGSPDVLTGLSSVSVFSDDDSSTGITLTLTETGDDTRIFTGTYDFTTTDGSSGTTLFASLGNVITYIDNTDAETQNAFIIPGAANEGAISAVPVGIGTIPGSTYFVSASYNGMTESLEISDDGSGGRGSGGFVRPGLVVDNPSSGGGGCNGNCSPPTLGLDQNFRRIVLDGFSYNGNPVNVEQFYTHYPLITSNVGRQNEVVLKIFDDEGPQEIIHVGLAFGLGKDQSFSESKAAIYLDRTFDGREITTTYDPENVLDNVKILTSIGPCGDSVEIQCLIVTIHHMFREQLKFNIVSTDVWDSNRNSWQNYYNDGVQIIGDSLNPPKTKMIAFGKKDMRGLYELTQIDKINDLWIDEFGSIYTHKGNNEFKQIQSTSHEKVFDKITTHGCDRKCNWFDSYKLNQELRAQIVLNEILDGKITQGEPPAEPFSYYYNILKRSEDLELQKNIIKEMLKAERLLEEMK